MRKFTAMSLAALLSAPLFVGCDSKTEYPSEETSSSVAVYSFSLQADKNVLVGLDSVFFSIDLEEGCIFNATPLPYGTPTNKLVPEIKTVDAVQAVMITVSRAGLPDTTYNYGTNPEDSIDFSNGPAKMEVTSANGLITRTYSVTVNVSDVKEDSLSWAETARRNLPTDISKPAGQKTVATSSKFYCLTNSGKDNTQWSLATATTPDGEWTMTKPNLSATAKIESFTAAGDKLYIIDGSSLMTSGDGITWTSTGRNFSNIYGAYGDKILGNLYNNGEYTGVEYPGSALYDIPDDMPVSGTSQMLPLDFSMADSRQVMLMGGEKANGALTSDVWGFDGTRWACITTRGIAKGLRDMTLVSYYTFRTPNILTTKEYVCLMAFGGTNGDEINRTVYTSVDYGMTWSKGGDLIQLPEYMPSVYGAQAFVVAQTLSDSRSSLWHEYMASRAMYPITDWECPYIYVFGGNTDSQTVSTYIWRGVINRMTFKPVQ